MTITITFPKAANGGAGQNGTNGTDAIFTQNGKIGADSLTVVATGQEGGDGGAPNGSGGKGGNASITLNGNIFNAPATNDVLVSLTATGGLGGLGMGSGVQGNGGNATVSANGNIVQPNKVMNNIFLDAIAVGGVGPKRGNASATVNGNVIQPSKGAVNVRLNATATVPGDSESHDGDANWGTKTATLNGNIVQGNISGTVTLLADTWDYNTPNLGASNGTASINGNIVQLNTTSTAVLNVEASGNHISITNNKFTVGLGALNLTVNEFAPYSDVTIKDNTFKGTGNNTFVFTDNVVQGSHTDTVVINLGASTFVFNGQNNTLTGFNSASVLGNGDPASLIGNDNNNTLTGGVGMETFTGGKGNDTIHGGGGVDTAVYSGNYAQYTIALPTNFTTGTVTDNTPGRDGTDTVDGIEFLQFADGTYNVATMVFTPTGPGPNTAPVLNAAASPVLNSELEDAVAPSGMVGTLVSSLVDLNPPLGGLDNVTDPDLGAVTGIALTAVDSSNGSWFFSIDNGTTWNAVPGGLMDSNALLLNSSARLYFQPNANYNGTTAAAITFRAWDTTSGTNGSTADASVNGGTTAFSTASDTASLTITSVNDAPAGADKLIGILEDAPYTFTAADFGFTDPNDSPANTLFAVKITTLPGAGTLTDNGNPVNPGDFIPVADITGGQLVFTPAANANGNGYANFTFQVQDNGGTANGGVDLDQSANTITFDVTPVNDAPAGTDATLNALVNTPYIFSTADFGFTDPNDSPANALFAVKITTLPGTGTLTYNGNPVNPGDFIPAADIAGGLLEYTSGLNTYGPGYASFTFQVQDDGGVANGGVDLDQSPNTITFDVAGGEEYFGTPGPDNHTGTNGDDIMHVSAGTDTLDGGPHINGDTLMFDTIDAGITYTINTASPAYTVGGNPGQTTATNFENLTGSPFDDVLTGDGGTNIIDGGAGDDILVATPGGDTLNGGANGAGGDTADFSGGGTGIIVDLNLQGGPQAIAGFGNVTLIGIENLKGTDFGDTLAGDANNNVLTGGAGNDILQGNGGDDTLDGAGGINTADYSYSTGFTNGLVVDLQTGTASGGGYGNDTLSNIQNVTGSDYNDTLIGDDADNTLAGGDGNDILYGHGGINTLDGGNGTDVAYYYGLESDPSYLVAGAAGAFTVLGGPEVVTDVNFDVERLKFLSPTHVSDADNNGYGDLIFQDTVTTGDIELHLLSSGDPDGSIGPAINISAAGLGLGSAWHAVGTGQFTPDDPSLARQAGLLLQNVGNGDLQIVTDLTGTPTALVSPISVGMASWKAISAGDFNGDASSDVLLQNTDGSVEIIFLNTDSANPVGTVASTDPVTSPGAAWKVIAAGDFNGDGKSDILWQNNTTKAVEVTLMDGATVTNTPPVLAAPGLTAIGTGDFNGDGFSDILFKNGAGNAVVWFMYGDTRTGTKTITKPGGSYTLKGAEDVDGNGFSDLLWQDTGTGATSATTLGGPSSLVNTTVLNPNFVMSPPAGAFNLVASTGGG